MKKLVLYTAVFSAFMLLFSCNMDRFDFSELNSVQAQGQWSLPIGSFDVSIETVFTQLSENDMVTYDDEGTIMLTYRYTMDTVVTGMDFMRYDDMTFPVSSCLENPYPYQLDEPVYDVMYVDQNLALDSDAFRIISAIIRSGKFSFTISHTTGNIQQVFVKSPNIIEADGTPFEREIDFHGTTDVDMAGLQFVSVEGNSLNLTYAIHYIAYDYTEPNFTFEGGIEVNGLRIKEMSAWINSFTAPYRVDSAFELPMANVQGELNFVDARLVLSDRNTFNLNGRLHIDTAMLYGDNVAPSNLFDEYPFDIDIHYTDHYIPFFNHHLNVDIRTDYTSLLVSGEFILNPDLAGQSHDDIVTLCDTSTIGLMAEGFLPIKFNTAGVHYKDTVDLNVDGVEAPELITEVLLHITFNSQLPFNLTAQMLTMETATGTLTDSLFSTLPTIQGSFDGEEVLTEVELPVTRELFSHLMSADKLILRLLIDTEYHDVALNLDDKIGVTIKADVFYDGEISTGGGSMN